MDKIRFLLLSGLLAVLLPGCVKDGINEGPEQIPGQNGDMEFVIGIAPQTRVSTGADFKSVWEDGDEIGVYAVAHGVALASSGNYIHNAKLIYNSADGGSWTQEPQLYWPTSASGISALDFYAYYPYDDNGGSPATLDPTEMVFNVKTDQSAAADYSASDLLTAKSNNNGDGWLKDSTVSLTFSHALSMVQLAIGSEVVQQSGEEDITVVLRGFRTGATLSLDTPEEVTVAGDTLNITMYRVGKQQGENYIIFRGLIPVQTLTEGMSLFRITYGEQLFNGSALPADLIMTSGQAEIFTLTIPPPDDGIVVPEANCYMVEPNSAALYIPVSQVNRVVTADGLGAEIEGLGGVTADNYTVELVWSDLPVGKDGVLTKMYATQYLDKGFVYVQPGVAGNAVVAIRDKDSGSIKWSWHIWVTEPVTSATDTETGLTWMDRNLGATANSPLINDNFDQAQWVKTLGLFYQWGRKDAFPGSDGTNNNQIYYTPTAPTGTTEDLPTGSYTELPGLVQNPLTFATNQYAYHGSLNVEGEDNDSWGGVSGAKTLYDPCPPGWKVPPIKIGDTNNWGTDNKSDWAAYTYNGRVFNGVNGTAALGHFYPVAGYRDVKTNGVMVTAGQTGENWSATSTGTTAYNLGFNKFYINPSNKNYRSYGFSVRCVAE